MHNRNTPIEEALVRRYLREVETASGLELAESPRCLYERGTRRSLSTIDKVVPSDGCWDPRLAAEHLGHSSVEDLLGYYRRSEHMVVVSRCVWDRGRAPGAELLGA